MIIGFKGYALVGKDTVAKCVMNALHNDMYSFCSTHEHDTNQSGLEYYNSCKKRHPLLNLPGSWSIQKFAGNLKKVASLLSGIPEADFEKQEVKSGNMPDGWWKWDTDQTNPHSTPHDIKRGVMTVREFLQKLGTEAVRLGLHEDAWVLSLMSKYKDMRSEGVVEWEAVADSAKTGWITPNRMFIPTPLRRLVIESPILRWFESSADPIYPNWLITDVRFANEADAIRERGGIIVEVVRDGVNPLNSHASEHEMKSIVPDYTFVNSTMNSTPAIQLNVNSFVNKHLLNDTRVKAALRLYGSNS